MLPFSLTAFYRPSLLGCPDTEASQDSCLRGLPYPVPSLGVLQSLALYGERSERGLSLCVYSLGAFTGRDPAIDADAWFVAA